MEDLVRALLADAVDNVTTNIMMIPDGAMDRGIELEQEHSCSDPKCAANKAYRIGIMQVLKEDQAKIQELHEVHALDCMISDE